jgi:nifR3 family TIM-barrel protein
MNKLTNLKLKKGAFLAPMADYTNVAFRELCKEYGASLVYTELISAKGLLYKSKKTKQMLAVSEKEKPVFLQLFGNDPAEFKKAVEIVEEKFPKNFAGFDLNAGCSVPKAKKGQYGSYLLDYPGLIGNIIKSMTEATEKPVTLKLRLGVSKETFIQCAKVAEDNGAFAVCLHPRLGVDGFGGKADWEKIKQLKKSVSIPVIGNGDIDSAEKAMEMKKETACDYVMIGRAAIGNAFLFKQTQALFEGKKIPQRTNEERKKEAERFLELVKEHKLGVNDARGYFISATKGMAGGSVIRDKVARAKNVLDLEKILSCF